MYCKNCGTENRDGAKFCRKCGVELGKQKESSKKEGGCKSKRIIPIVVIAAIIVAGICVLAFRWARSRAADAEYEDYLAVQESIEGIEASYRNESGYHDPERIPDLLDEVESYGLENSVLVTSVDRGDDYVEFRLSDGTLYFFTPSIEGLLSGGVECSIVTLEPWWTDVEGVGSLHIDEDDFEIDGFTEVSGFDAWAHAVPEAIDEYSFASNDNVNDSDVTIERLRMIGRNQFVFYFGHGGAPTKSHGSFLTTGEATTKESRERYKDDLKADRLVQTSSGRLAVTDKFFDSSNFGDNAFNNTDFFLVACHSCQDTQLADALIGCGARTATGFTESVTVRYGTEMMYGILGLNDDAKGLTDIGRDGKYLTFAESISNAQTVYGTSDSYMEFKWYEAKHDPAEAVCYPVKAARRERLSDTLVAYLDVDKDAAIQFIQVWYNDWTFKDGHDVQNARTRLQRCLPLIAEDSELYDEFEESCNSLIGKYARDFASCAVSKPQAEELDGGVFRVRVRFIGTQNTVDQAIYDELISNPSEDVWDVTVDEDNKITSLKKVVEASDYESAASSFIFEWYDDWTFEDGHDVANGESYLDRCLPYVDPESDFYREFSEAPGNDPSSEYWRWDVAVCVIGELETEMVSDKTCRVTVRYAATQNTVDQARYDKMVQNPSTDVWDVSMNDACKVVGIERVKAPADGDSSASAQSDAEVTNGKTVEGHYRLSGTVRVHEEDIIYSNKGLVNVVSLILDESVPYEYEYKGIVESEAREVCLVTGLDDTYEAWAQYDGQHIAIECDGLRGVYHDNAQLRVDTIAQGNISLISVDNG